MNRLGRIAVCFSAGQIFVCLWYSLTHYVSGWYAAMVMTIHFGMIYGQIHLAKRAELKRQVNQQ